MRRRRSSAISNRIRTLLFTDLDGTLLAHDSYSWVEARPAIERLRRRQIPLIFCSSKTRSEVQALRRAIGNTDPFIVENGGLVVIPARYFPRASPSARSSRTLTLGQPYQRTVQALQTIAHNTGVEVRGFHQMTAEDIAQMTGLSLQGARLARKRESGEPFVFLNATAAQIRNFTRLAHQAGYSVQRGGRFWHISGGCDKGLAVSTLIGFYRVADQTPVRTVALGDSANDLPMLQVADHPILMPKIDGSFDHDVAAAIPLIQRAREPGPAGWAQAVLDAIREPSRSRPAARKRPRRQTASAPDTPPEKLFRGPQIRA